MFGLLGTNLFCVVILSGTCWAYFKSSLTINMPMISVDCMLQGTDLLRYAKNHIRIMTS